MTKVREIPYVETLYIRKRKVDGSIDHIVTGCSKFEQKEYKGRHDNKGKIVYWKLARKCNFEAGDKRYEHETESVSKNEYYNIL